MAGRFDEERRSGFVASIDDPTLCELLDSIDLDRRQLDTRFGRMTRITASSENLDIVLLDVAP